MYYTSIVALGMLVISPLLSLPFILWDIYKQHRAGLVLFILFLAVMASLTAPMGDLFRHTRDYFYLEHYSFDAFWHNLHDDFLVQTFAYFLHSYDIKYPVARLIFTILGYSISFWIFDDLVRDKYSNREYFFLFLLFFCTSGYFGFVTGVRNVFASKFFILGFYLLYEKDRKISALIPLAIAPCIHFSFLSLSILIYVLYFLRFEMTNKVFIVLGVVLFAFGLVLSTFLVSNLFESHADYLEGQWGTDYHVAIKGMIYHYIGKVWWIPMFYFFMTEKIEGERWNKVIFVFALLFCMTCQLATISGRLLMSLTAMLVIFYLKYNSLCIYKLEKIIFLSAIFIFFCSVYNYRAIIVNPEISAYGEALKPLPMALQHDFDKQWVYSHIRRDGDIKNKYK